jgi:four helix bundle protein
MMNKEELKTRTKKYVLNMLNFIEILPNNNVGWALKGQIVRSSTSVGANYRAVCRSKSDKDFISKMETVIEEADETLFWLEIIEESKILKNVPYNKIQELKNETNQLISIFVASVKTVKNRLNNS